MAPGYRAPEPAHIRLTVEEGACLELPGIWLAPLPRCCLQIVDTDGSTPVKGAFIRLLRPNQLGWTCTDIEGRAFLPIIQWPQEGQVYGLVENATGTAGALFAVDRSQADQARVQLLPYATIEGEVHNHKGNPVAGALVGSVFFRGGRCGPPLPLAPACRRHWPLQLARRDSRRAANLYGPAPLGKHGDL